MKTKKLKKLLSVILCFALIMSYLPLTALITSAASESTSVADPKTLGSWQNWFSKDSTRYAGGVFLDKSVYTATEAVTDSYFADVKSSLAFGEDNFGNDNFMVALSALGSNSEILGYSHTPTDTMIVLDASTSMGTGSASSSAIDDMVNGANEAMKRLLSLNNYNRVGVVIYNGSSRVLLPLDRYTSTASSGNLLQYQRKSGQNRIYIASNVLDGKGKAVDTDYFGQTNGTYTQGGFYAAMQEFLKADTVIEDGKIQGGTKRLPIMVFMSDGEPSYRTYTGDNTTVDKYTKATNANCDGNGNYQEDDITAFSTMLTAAWAEGEITAHYGTDARVYTLGYALSANHSYAHNVLDPLNPNNTLYDRFKGFADKYLAMNTGATQTFTGAQTFKVKRASSPARVKSLDYVDRYWQASDANKLTEAFDSIVDEIIIQSRYYSTLVTGNKHHQDGFIFFTDEIGTHMEIKNIKGIYIGEGKLISGGMFAEFATTGKVEDFDSEKYSEEALDGFENEILSAIAERFEITLSKASQLVNSARDNGFISYKNTKDFSNYIAWYADADNKYIAPYTGAAAKAASNAKYIVRSYFYMGDVTQNHVETSILYALVRVREDIETGRQIVDMNVPAALLPMVTYTITVDGDTLTEDNLTGLTCTQKKPLSLLYEVGLDDEITPYNIVEKMDGEDFRKNSDGSYEFYTNRWRSNTGTAFTIPQNPDPHIFNHGIMNTTVTQFIPSLENERYYYTKDSQILNHEYKVYEGTSAPEGKNYYTLHSWIEKESGKTVIKTSYNPVSEATLADKNNVMQISGKKGWFIKKGTAEFYFGDKVHGEQAHDHKSDNKTETLGWSNYPYIVHHESEGHTGYHMLNYLGNNGRITATPAQGIKLTKEITQRVEGATDQFTFNITLSGSGIAVSYPVHIERANGTTEDYTEQVINNALSVVIGAGDTAYITDISAGIDYTVTESYNSYYAASSSNASGTVTSLTLSPVHFVNSPKSYGSLLVEKDVTHPTIDTVSHELANKEFDITVKFQGDQNALAEIVPPANATTADNGVTYTLKLKDGYDGLFTNIPEGVKYTVTESNIPDGFTLKTDTADLSGEIAGGSEAQALLVNDYTPDSVSANITVSGEKTVVGRPWDNNADKYQVALQPVVFGGQGTLIQGEPTVVNVVKADGADYTVDMSGISYSKPGTYSYIVYEIKPDTNPVPNISYDGSIGTFSVKVIDNGSGKLIIESVTGHEGTATVSGNSNSGWKVEKNFTNTYMAEKVTVPVKKLVVDGNGNPTQGHSGGLMLGLFDSVTAKTPVYNTITDKNGDGNIIWNVLKDDYQTVKYFYLREIVPPVGSQVVGMTYDDSFKYVVAVDWSTGAKPTVKYYKYNASAANGLGTEITDVSANPLAITNIYDDSVETNALVFGGKKTLNGGALRAGDSFTFTMYQTDATFNISNSNAKVLQTVTVNQNSANGAFTFDGVEFETVGTKYLVIAENKGADGKGITYDSTTYHITVDVSKTLKNNKVILTARAEHIHHVGHGDVEADNISFNNTYSITDSESVVIKGNKTLTGRTLIEGEFAFGLYKSGETEPMYTVYNKADGSFTFPEISYKAVNASSYAMQTDTYIIKEIEPTSQDKKGIEYDKKEYTVIVTVEDNGDGTLKKTVTLDNKAVSGDIQVSFENKYSASNTKAVLSGEKTLEGKSEGSYEFYLYETDETFAIADASHPYKTATATVQNGKGSFEIELEYDSSARGYHYYVLLEAVPQDTEGVYYDTTRYHIIINSLDNGHGEMEAHIISVDCPYFDGEYTHTTLNFVNKYHAASTEYTISGKKNYNEDLEAGMFEFVLSNADGEIATVENAADGSFVFPTQTFESEGSYVFYVTELKGGTTQNGITYDGAKYTVTIPVVDNGIGHLVVDEQSISIEKTVGNETESADEIEFTNVYTPEDDNPDNPDKRDPDNKDEGDKKPNSSENSGNKDFINPLTGDSSDLSLWFALLFVSGGGLVGIGVYFKKKELEITE